MHTATEAPRTHINSQVVASRVGFKIVRLRLPAGESLPSHNAPRDVAVAVVGGAGTISVGSRDYAVEPGVVVEIPAGAAHGVRADDALDVLIIQAS